MNRPPEDYSLFFRGSAARGRTGVLLIHSLGGAPLELETVARGLAARGLTVSCCQLAGHCGTEDDLLNTNWTDWFASAEQSLAALEKQCDVIVIGGLAIGGVLALRLAALYPDRVHGIALFAPTLWYDGWAIPWYSFLLEVGYRLPVLRGMRFAERPPYGIKDETTRSVVVKAMLAGKSSEAGLFNTSLGALREANQLVRDVLRRLSSIKTQTLIVHSREDDISDVSNAIYLQRHLGGVVGCLVLDDSYHVITLDRQRELVMDRTDEFIASLERQRTRRPAAVVQLPSAIATE